MSAKDSPPRPEKPGVLPGINRYIKKFLTISYHLTRTLDHHWHWMMITWGEVWNESLAHRLALHHPFQLLNIEECLVNFISDLSYFSSPFIMTASMMIGCDRRAGKLDAGCCWCWCWCWRQWWWSGVRLVTATLPCGRGGAQVTRHSSTLHPLHCSLTTTTILLHPIKSTHSYTLPLSRPLFNP